MDEMYTPWFWPHGVFFERVGGAYCALFCALVFAVVNESSSVLLSVVLSTW